MGWYNAGNWTGLDATLIPEVIADLCNAVNERRECLGRARVAWRVNTGTESSPTTGTKSTDLVAADLHGLPLMNYNYLQPIFDEIEDLVAPSSTITNLTKCTGFAKTSTSKGLAADSSKWTLSSIATDCGIAIPTITGIYSENGCAFMREALDRMIYPIIYPSVITRTQGADYGSNHGTVDSTDVEAIWDHMSTAGGHSDSHDVYAQVSSINPSLGSVYYTALATLDTEYEFSPLYNESAAGYSGTITRQWFAANYGKNTSIGDASALTAAFMGATATMDSATATSDIACSSTLSLTAEQTESITMPTMITTDNPFSGTFDYGGGDVASGIGICFCYLLYKYDRTGLGQVVNSGEQYTRWIVDISAELTDQA